MKTKKKKNRDMRAYIANQFQEGNYLLIDRVDLPKFLPNFEQCTEEVMEELKRGERYFLMHDDDSAEFAADTGIEDHDIPYPEKQRSGTIWTTSCSVEAFERFVWDDSHYKIMENQKARSITKSKNKSEK